MGGAVWRGKRGTYREVKVIAKGGMGTAYEAVGPGGRPVVVKVAATESNGRAVEPDRYALFVKKLMVEAEALRNFARQSPPNIVRYVDEAAAGDSFFLAVEKIEGRPLNKAIPPMGYAEDVVVSMSLDVLRGLEFVHRHNTVYRDIKPANVMVRPDGRCVMIDFGGVKQGMASAPRPESGGNTQLGTPGWACPHQNNQGGLSAECDLYAFGRVMFYMGTGISPVGYTGPDGRITKTMRDMNPGVSGEMSGLVERMADPAHGRVRTASEAIRELSAMRGRPAAPVQRVARVAQAAPPRPGAGPAFALSARPPLRRRAGRVARRTARNLAWSMWMSVRQPAPPGRAPARRGRRARPVRGPARGPARRAPAGAAALRGAGALARAARRAARPSGAAGRARRQAAAQAAARPPWRAARAAPGALQRARAAAGRAARAPGRGGGARIILQGVEYQVSEGPGGSLIGSRHGMDACRAAGGGCNERGRGRNVFVGWSCPPGCGCAYNPAHVIGRHHMRVRRGRGGRMTVENNDPDRRSAINRGGAWEPMRHGRAEELRDRDRVALLYNESKGPYMEFTFYEA